MENNSNASQKKSFQLSRRQFFQFSLPLGLMLGFGTVMDKFRNPSTPLRPPGGQDEDRFLSLCLNCYQCVEVCPLNVIQMIDLQKDLGRMGTPTLDFSQGYCNFCNKCIDACPTGALAHQEVSEPKIGIAEIDKKACIAWSWMGCNQCYTACPYDAIELDSSGRPYVVPEKCNGCGVCEHICPRASLRNYDINHPTGIKVRPLDTFGA